MVGTINNSNYKDFESANCLEDGILHVSSQRKRFLDPIGEDFQDEDILFEFDLPTTSANLNSYAQDIVKYIAGAIVGKLIYPLIRM